LRKFANLKELNYAQSASVNRLWESFFSLAMGLMLAHNKFRSRIYHHFCIMPITTDIT